MAATWQPLESGLLQLVNLLTEYQKPGTNQSQIFQQLEACKQYPDFNNYLTYIFAAGESLPIEVRQSAGLLLKNNLAKQFKLLSPDFKSYIKATLLPVLGHKSRDLRHTAGTIASVLVGLDGLDQWPDLITGISACLQADGDPNALDGAQDSLYKILEDHPTKIEAPVLSAGGAPASTIVVPPLLRLMQSPSEDVRRSAVACLNMMAPDMPKGLIDNIDAYLHGLFALANDASSRVRKEVVTGLVAMTGMMPDRLTPFMPQLVEYMLASNEHPEQAVALAGAEFWASYMELGLDPAALAPYLGRLIGVLMRNMVFDEYDEEVQEAEAAEEARVQVEDKDTQLRPFHQKNREHAPGAEANGGAAGADGEDGDDGGGDDDDDDGAIFSQWNLRKCSAEALDILSNNYGDAMLPLLLPVVQERLQDPSWRARESAILALGAVSNGCHQGLQPHLEGMIGMLLPRLADPRPMVRVISCWTLSRYCHWLFLGVAEGRPEGRRLLDEVMAGVLRRLATDRNKYVQVAAVSALVEVAETAADGHHSPGQLLEPYLRAMFDAMAVAVSSYTRRSVVVAYEALAVLGRILGPRMAEPAFAAVYLPPLMHKLASLGPNDKDLLPLLECLASVAPHVGQQLQPVAKPVFDRCIALATAHLEAQQRAAAAAAAAGSASAAAASTAGPAAGAAGGDGAATTTEYDASFVALSLDVISGVAQGLGPGVEPLVAGGPLVQVVLHCCSDASPDVRQSSFALVGDLATCCVGQLLPVLPQLVAAGLAELELPRLSGKTMSAANNACWSLGEVAVKAEPASLLQPHAEAIAERATAVLSYRGRMPGSILENCAITLGRVAWRCPDQLAPHLAHFCGPWCAQLRNLRDGVEKEHAFLGLCRLVRTNPEAAVPSFSVLCQAFASWRHVQCEGLLHEMGQILAAFKASLAASGAWPAALASVGEPVRGKLAHMGMPL